jgi:hypothetical protein
MLDDSLQPLTASPGEPHRLYPKLLGAAWHALDPAVQRIHTDPAATHAEGVFQVSRAPGALMWRILDAAQVPPASNATEVHLAVCHRGLVERWHRAFGSLPLVTLQTEAPGGLLAERIGILEFRFRLVVKHGALLFRQEGFAIRLGPFRVPLPEWLSIKIAGREGPAGGPDGASDLTTVDVRVTAPTGSLLFAYRGTVRWSASGDVT